MKTLTLFLMLIFVGAPLLSQAQPPERWEEIGPVDFTAIANQSRSTLVMPTTDGFLYVSTDFGATWQHHYVDDTLSLLDVHFVDSLHGMLISWIGDVLFTSDGGVSWAYSHVPAHPTRSAYLSPDTAILCDDSGAIWRTTDRGNTWDSERVFQNALYAVDFTSSQTGFVCGDAGAYAMTTDGGTSWNVKDIGAGDSIYFRAIDFYDGDTGAIGGFSVGNPGDFGHAFITTNGGATWTDRAMPSAWIVRINYIKMVTGTTLFGAGLETDAWVSTDLGESWNLSSIDADQINGAATGPDNQVLMVGSLGVINRSGDGGLTWQMQNICTGAQQEYMINFADTLLGVDINGGFTFIRSTDAGNSWVSVSLLNRFPWAGILFSNSLDGLAPYPDALDWTLQTTDGGLTWGSTTIPFYDTANIFPYYNAYASSNQAAYLMYGDVGGIYSSDYGTTWSNVTGTPNDTTSPFPNEKPAQHVLTQISALDEMRAYMIVEYVDTVIGAGSGGNNPDYNYYDRIFQSFNAGQSWEEMKNAPAEPLSDQIYFHDPSHGFLCCDSGVVFRTTDSGQSWIRESVSAPANNITGIGFLNDTLGFCGAHNAHIFRTTDGGITWQDDSLRIGNDGTGKNVNEYFIQFLFPDSNTVIATTTEGFYRRKLLGSPPASVAEGSSQPDVPLAIYPNPTSSILHVISNSSDITVTDLLGRTWLYSIDSAHDLDVSMLPQGVYYISDATSRAQFVKE